MAGFDFDVKDRVRQAIDIVDLIGRSLELRRQGRNFVARCPWHDDRRPSLQVNPDRQSWKCWVCNIGGDVFSFVMQREGVAFGEALRMLADQAGIALVDGPSATRLAQSRDEKQAMFRLLAWAAAQFRECLVKDAAAAAARDYLAERGLAPESLETYGVGFAPDQWSWLIDRARPAGFRVEELEAVGLVTRSDSTGKPLDRFRGRVIFPIRDTQLRPIAFGGRVLPEIAKRLEAQGQRVPAKYVNSPETKLFSKSDVLYGLDVARDEVVRQRRIVVMEGYTDVIMARQFGITTATAVLGTALNERHIKLIRRFAETVILLLDGDAAGQRRTNEILDLFVGTDLDLRILTLPDGLDPADYLLKHGGPALGRAIDGAVDALDHKLATELQGFDPVRDTHRAFRAAENVLATLAHAPRVTLADSSARLREQQIVGRLARTLAIPDDELRRRLEEMRRARRTQQRSAEARDERRDEERRDDERRQGGSGERRVSEGERFGSEQGAEPNDVRPPLVLTPPASWPVREVQLLEVLLLAPDRIDSVLENIGPDRFVDPLMRRVYECFDECYRTHGDVEFSTLLTSVEEPQLKSILVELDERARSRPESDLAGIAIWLQQVIAAFAWIGIDQTQRHVLSALSTRRLSDEEEASALQHMLEAKQREQELQRARSTPMEGR
ncbi:MAG TPA: DNA primase [Pirellulaceae bacterium]|nr:DNA primase [Pirellulaceae bacterium]